MSWPAQSEEVEAGIRAWLEMQITGNLWQRRCKHGSIWFWQMAVGEREGEWVEQRIVSHCDCRPPFAPLPETAP